MYEVGTMKFFRRHFKFLSFLIALGIGLYFLAFPFIIEGNSMQNTFQNHDRIIVSRILAKINIKRGDVVICKYNKIPIIKRIIALPGENISIENNCVRINNKLIFEPYVLKNNLPGDKFISYTLQADQYFVMGDNRISSVDSRNFGPVSKNNISAKVLFKFFPSFAFVNFNWED